MRSGLLFGMVSVALLAVGCGQTDAGITTSVKSQLAADDLVSARSINVDTQEGVVTLTGEVESVEEEATAMQIARTTDGVADVVDQLAVVQDTAPTTGIGDAPRPSEPGQAPPVPSEPRQVP